jgi:hypothetical protein
MTTPTHELAKHEVGIQIAYNDLVGGETATAECPECFTEIEYDYLPKDGIGKELYDDCLHYIGRGEYGDTALFLSLPLKGFYTGLLKSSSPVISPGAGHLYSVRPDDEQRGLYMVLRFIGSKSEKVHSHRSRWHAALWCVGDVIERNGR